ncbi:MAG: energy transducer TonB [Bacteroidetes bacterium]|nr:MAG: energy transducer TonB [Bacteroidota bacterium]
MKTFLSLIVCLLFGSMLSAQINSEVPPPPPPPKPAPGLYQETFVVVEQMPRFPGCEDLEGSDMEKQKCSEEKMIQYVAENIQYPAEAKKAGIEGRCFIKFIVEKDGTISHIDLKRDIGGGCGQEAVRVVESMNENGLVWTPGQQRGKKVRVQYTLPVQFKLGPKKH